MLLYEWTREKHNIDNDDDEQDEHQQLSGFFFFFFFFYLILILILIIIIIAFKGAIQDFLQSPHSAANYLQHVRSSDPGAIVCKSRAAHQALITCNCHDTCHLVRRDSSVIQFDRVEIAFI